jgi:hypothetical protein
VPREHERLVAGAVEIGADASWIAHHDHAIRGVTARITPAQNRGALAARAQAVRHESGQRRLGTAADGEIADADDGT